MNRTIRMWLIGFLLLTAMLTAACARSDDRRATSAAPNPTGNCSQLDPAARAAELRGQKQRNSVAPDGSPANNRGDWAYPSIPQNISGPGTYTFRFGPLADDFTLSRGFVASPPPDFTGTVKPATEPRIAVELNGRFLEWMFEVGGTAGCHAMVIVIY
jgi:hypothetical protein